MNATSHIFISISLLCVFGLHVHGQLHIDTLSFRYHNGITLKNQITDCYRITNNTKEEYLTWVSLVSTSKKSKAELIHDFFKIRKGDFNFIEMMHEELLRTSIVSIGYSFVKNIAVGETFSYFITHDNPTSMGYQDRIVIMKRKEVEQYLRVKIMDYCFFQSDFIVLTEN